MEMTNIEMTNEELIEKILELEGFNSWNFAPNRREYFHKLYKTKERIELMEICQEAVKFVRRFEHSIKATLRFKRHTGGE